MLLASIVCCLKVTVKFTGLFFNGAMRTKYKLALVKRLGVLWWLQHLSGSQRCFIHSEIKHFKPKFQFSKKIVVHDISDGKFREGT